MRFSEVPYIPGFTLEHHRVLFDCTIKFISLFSTHVKDVRGICEQFVNINSFLCGNLGVLSSLSTPTIDFCALLCYNVYDSF